MRLLFDQIYFGCYYFVTLQERLIRLCLRPILLFFGCLLGKIPFIENYIRSKFGMTVLEYCERSMNLSWNNDFVKSMKGFDVNYLLGPLFTALGFDIILIIWHICGKSFAFLSIGRFQKGFLVFAFSMIFMYVVCYFLYDRDCRSDKIIKEYIKKDNHQKRNALIIYIASNVVVVLTLVELLFGKLGILNLFGW